MTIANMKPEEKSLYDLRFQTFLFKIVDVAKYSPREKYLYPIMNGVPFRDLEVALDMAVQERAKRKANDNKE
ncbi:MAG: hypothetical protein DI551_07680 [Micavibrio aeruginosavorus]|uniref:Uncharacterized protein n=1 Tax=Micavibrio aeruginosavorus TaxID=349221 RepID=A0A2W5MVT5_9BACT|nr:MAG: hypothetical protein DI551_07680 [Micavibrio aeruginosavorus]